MHTSTSSYGLRERKKDDTRRALSQVAYRLTLDRGFDGFTVAEVADGAGVSRRTFSNYFASKAECVMAWSDANSEQLIATFNEADPSEPIDQLIRRLLRLVTAEADGDWGAILEIVHTHPELRAESLVNEERMAGAVAEAIAGRLGIAAGDVVAQALSLFAMTSCRVVLGQWVETGRPGGRDGLTLMLERVFLLLDPQALDSLRHHAPAVPQRF